CQNGDTPVMSTPSTLRHSNWDALLVGLSLVHAAALLRFPSIPLIALGLWWNSNTVSHNFIHLPFFRSSRWNRVYSIFLTLLVGYPQSVWRDRHLAHHAGQRTVLKRTPLLLIESCSLLALWSVLLWKIPEFFWWTYIPGIALGLSICYVHGYFEHAGGATSH